MLPSAGESRFTDAALTASLNVTAMRGVEVRIVIPEKTNLALVQGASTAQLWQILERGCRVQAITSTV